MKITPIIFLLFCCFSYSVQAQSIKISGIITDTKNNEPVPFATLGIKGKSIGTVADENGTFSLLIENAEAAEDEKLIISSVGYESKAVSIRLFKQGKQTIGINPSSTSLQTVNIKPEKYKTKVFGRTGSNTMMTANMYTERNHIDDNLGKEQATIISVDQNCFVRDFNMFVTFNRFDLVKFRLNFYSVKDGAPDELINDKDILFDVTQKNGWLKVDLKNYNVYLTGHRKVAVAIQWVKSVKTDTTAKSFSVSVMPVPLHAMFARDKSQAGWKKTSPAYLAFNITADSFKTGKKEEAEK